MREIHYKLDAVLDWESKETLRQTLVDQAEIDLGVGNIEGEMTICVEGDEINGFEFVVYFEPSKSINSAKRIMAKFIPQVWLNDYAMDVDGEIEFDITDKILSMGKEKALRIKDDDYDSDHLWQESSSYVGHSGPFRIECSKAIQDYFDSQSS